MNLRSKGLARLVFFFVFLIPVAWYLFLQLFGSNSFTLNLISEIPKDCQGVDDIAIISKSDSLSTVKTNYMNRVVYATDKREVSITYVDDNYFDCINQSGVDLVLINKKGVWGGYELNREDVDRLITELDILMLQESYGKGTRR